MSYHDQFDKAGKGSGGDEFRRGNVPGRFDRIMVPKEHWVYVRLIPGEYPVTLWEEAGKSTTITKPYFESKRHVLRPKTSKDRWEFLTCARGLNDYSDPAKCPLCNLLEDDREREAGWFAAHTVLGLANYHIVEKASKKAGGKPYKNYVACEVTDINPNCTMCASKYPFQLGFLGHFSASWSDNDELKRLNREMGEHCQCGGDIIAVQAACPTCHTVLASIESGGMSDSEFHRFLNNRQVCPTCRTQVDVVSVRRCTACAEPRPLSIYDANIRLMRTKKGEANILKGEIMSWGPLDPSYGKVEPLDLAAIYAPEPTGRLTNRIPGHRGMARANPNDPGGIARNPMEAAAAAAMASGTAQTAPLPPGVFGKPKTQAPAPMPKGGQAALPFMKSAGQTKAPMAPPPLTIPPDLPDEGDLGVNDEGDQ